MSPSLPLLVGLSALAVSVVLGASLPRTWLVLTFTGTAAILASGLRVLIGGTGWTWRSGFLLGGEPIHLELDGLSAVFLVLASVVGAAGAAYAREYWSDHHHPASGPRGRAWWSAMVLSMGLVLTVSNGLHFLIAWELFAVCGYFLITLESRERTVRRAGWLYLAASHAGTVCLCAFFALLATRTGGWDLGPVRTQATLAPLFWLALMGFGMKAGFFPLHLWLPSAHANAPSHVSAILSGAAIKMGVYGLMRFSGWMTVPASAGWTVVGLGALSALLGIAFACAQNDFKRLLAYSSVENVGVILIGLGAALLARTYGDASWGTLVLAGALLHVWNHGAFKTLLFLGAGSVVHATGTREMSRLGGLWRRMPWTAASFAVGSAAVAGLPPLNGFISEWLIYLGLFEAVATRHLSAWAAAPAVILLAMSGALALAGFAKAGAIIFLGAGRTKLALNARESGRWMRAPMLALAVLCVALGLGPTVIWPAVATAVGAWDPAWAPTTAPSPLRTLGLAHLALAWAVAAGGVLLWRKARAIGLRRELTWDCGYVAPSAKMQYTSGSFAGLVASWFAWILRPARTVRRPRGHFPLEAIRLEWPRETVLEQVVTPIADVIMHVSTAVRRLQHGRLPAYILYLVAGLAALGVIAVWGSTP